MTGKTRKQELKKPMFFATPSSFRSWLEKNHKSSRELWVGFHKRGTGKQSITWPESVDQALCFGWIDGLRKSLNSESYMIRFTPRRPESTWSQVNTRRAQELMQLGRMHSSGKKVFEGRDIKKSDLYSFDRAGIKLKPAYEKLLRANRRAWAYFQSQAPWYRRTVTWWVMSAKQETTQQRRLGILISDSSLRKRIAPMRQEKTNRL